MMKKIVFGVCILLILLGTVYAANNNEIFNAPSSLKPVGNNDFVDQQGHNIMIAELTDDGITTWLQNDTDPVYLVEKYNDTIYVGTDDEKDCYLHEVVEKDGKKYLITSWTPNGAEETPTIQSNLEEFNKLNNLKPLEIDSVT